MKATILLSFLLILFLSCNIKRSQMETFEVHFQDGFSNDTVSMKLNDCSIFEGLILNSAADIGLTDVITKVELEGEKATITYDGKSIKCQLESQRKITITLLVNNIKTEHLLNLSKGKYIGFEMSNKGVYLSQSKIPFEYD